jgi:DNA-binding MarR family transcriptional regulator
MEWMFQPPLSWPTVRVCQYTALTVLERHPDLSSAQLARNSFVTTQSMADMVAALEERGLIERHRDAADRRRLVLALTEDGRALLRRYREARWAPWSGRCWWA